MARAYTPDVVRSIRPPRLVETGSTNHSTIEGPPRKYLFKKQLPVAELEEAPSSSRKSVIVRSGPSKRKLEKRASEGSLHTREDILNVTWKLTDNMDWRPRDYSANRAPDPALISELLSPAPLLEKNPEEARSSIFRSRRKDHAKHPRKKSRRPSQSRMFLPKARLDPAELLQCKLIH